MDRPAAGGVVGRREWSLRHALARLLLVAALLPALLFGMVAIFDQYLGERRQLVERLAASARVTAASIDQFVLDHLAGVALLADVRSGAAADWSADLAALRNRHPELLTALVTDAEGRVLAAHPQSRLPAGPLLGVADRDYFIQARRTLRPYVSNAFRGRGLGDDPLVAVSAPMLREGRFDGVVEGSIRVDAFTRNFGEAFVARGYELLLLDRSQHVIYATPGLGLGFLDEVDADARFGAAGGAGQEQARPGVFPGPTAGYAARAGMENGWTLVVAVRETALLEDLAGRAWALLGMLALVILGTILASWWQMRHLARGTRELLHVLHGLALGARPSSERLADMPVELKPVAQAIDELTARLNQAYGGLQAALGEQRRLAESLRTVLATRDQEIAERTAELRKAVAELDRLSRTDHLTGCLNVRGLDDWIESDWRSLRESGTPLGVLAMDIDHFKAFNDHYGHPAGDVALKRVVGAARGALRGPGDEIARVGGEEFLVLLPGADRERALEVAERIREAVREAGIPHETAPDGILTLSLGVAVAEPDADQDVRHAVGRADQALYRAKDAGRDRVSD